MKLTSQIPSATSLMPSLCPAMTVETLIFYDHPLLPVANDIRTALDLLAGRLGKTGATVAWSSKLLPDLTELAKLHVRMIRNFAAFDAPPEVFQKARERGNSGARRRQPQGAVIGRARLRAQWRKLFREFDVVVCPPFPRVRIPA